MVARAYRPRTWEVEAEASEVQGHPKLPMTLSQNDNKGNNVIARGEGPRAGEPPLIAVNLSPGSSSGSL